MGRGIVIRKLGGKEYRKGKKTRVRYPSMMGGYITHTFISRKCAKDYIKHHLPTKWAERRAKLIPVEK